MTDGFNLCWQRFGASAFKVLALLIALALAGVFTVLPAQAEEPPPMAVNTAGPGPFAGEAPPVSATIDAPGSFVEEPPALDDSTADPDLFADESPVEMGPLNGYVADPLESINRVFFAFNDKLYFWVLKPVARGYALVVPKVVRESAGNFFFNLKTPVRLVNSALQAKFERSGVELARFAVNSTVGVVGLWDPARNWLKLSPSDEDFGQTLGKYGVGEGFYLCWPILGPANLRDSLGLAGDHFLNPVSYLYLNHENEAALEIRTGETVNQTSLRLGDYEAFKEASFDPYSAMRDSYTQSRRSKINDEPDKPVR